MLKVLYGEKGKMQYYINKDYEKYEFECNGKQQTMYQRKENARCMDNVINFRLKQIRTAICSKKPGCSNYDYLIVGFLDWDICICDDIEKLRKKLSVLQYNNKTFVCGISLSNGKAFYYSV